MNKTRILISLQRPITLLHRDGYVNIINLTAGKQEFFYRVGLKAANVYPIWITALSWGRGVRNATSYEPCCVGPPKTDASQQRVLTKCCPLEKKMANYSSTLASKTSLTVWNGKKIWHQKMNPRGQRVSYMLLGKRREQLLIAPIRMKWLGQSGNFFLDT